VRLRSKGHVGGIAHSQRRWKSLRSLRCRIVADGEGAQRVIEIEVRGAKTEAAAKRIAETMRLLHW